MRMRLNVPQKRQFCPKKASCHRQVCSTSFRAVASAAIECCSLRVFCASCKLYEGPAFTAFLEYFLAKQQYSRNPDV